MSGLARKSVNKVRRLKSAGLVRPAATDDRLLSGFRASPFDKLRASGNRVEAESEHQFLFQIILAL